MVIHIKKLLDRSLKQSGLKHRVDIALVLEKAGEVLLEVVGEKVAKNVQPVFVRNKTMNLACLNSSVAQEIKLYESQIIEKINKNFDRELVERLSFTT